tara:strand:- start:6 stop:188 length:183 start_codon:yes stop_codon:yes gene_type:complete
MPEQAAIIYVGAADENRAIVNDHQFVMHINLLHHSPTGGGGAQVVKGQIFVPICYVGERI